MGSAGYTSERETARAAPVDWERPYCFARGFSCRREAFGGILYHYAGVKPNPEMYFLRSPFLIALLELIRAHPRIPLGSLMHRVGTQAQLNAAQQHQTLNFLATLVEKGALTPAASPPAKKPCTAGASPA